MTLRIISLICYVVTITLLNVMILRQGKKIRELERALSEEHKQSDCNCNYAEVIQGIIEDNRRKEDIGGLKRRRMKPTKPTYSHTAQHFTGKKRGNTPPRKKKGVVKKKSIHKNKYQKYSNIKGVKETW